MTFSSFLTPARTLPVDAARAVLVGRLWQPSLAGPSVVRIDGDALIDLTHLFPTMSDLCEAEAPARAIREAKGSRVESLADVLANTPVESRLAAKPWLLAPIDLQAVKACGVTFAVSMLERVIEERARGNPGRGRNDPRRASRSHRRRPRQAQARLAGGA